MYRLLYRCISLDVYLVVKLSFATRECFIGYNLPSYLPSSFFSLYFSKLAFQSSGCVGYKYNKNNNNIEVQLL